MQKNIKDKSKKPGTHTGVLDLFHPLVKQWFIQQVGTPTTIQQLAWPEIAKGNHVLVTAPTGSGKTLTAFLWAINYFLVNGAYAEQNPGSGRVLYISPLKALNNDIQRNLQLPIEQLREVFESAGQGQEFPTIRVAVRSGDTEPAERREMMRFPPGIFITTPESLNILLSSKNGRRSLLGFSTVILDEIHAVVPSKRGTYLMTAIERLVPLCGEFQRIAISATINPMDTVAEFIGGYRMKDFAGHYEYEKRRVSIIKANEKKRYDLRVEFPENAKETARKGEWWPALTEAFRRVVARNRSTLFFADSRRLVEKVTRFINEGVGTVLDEHRVTPHPIQGDRVYSHHGSLAKEIRRVVEKRFKDGELSGIVATSSLELGIDIGSVDEVVLIQAPFSIASAVQRIGRSGHGVGQVSRGVFYPLHSRAFLEAAVIAAQIDKETIEPLQPVTCPLDVLAQVLLSMTLLEKRKLDDCYAEIRASYPYHDLKRKEFDLVVEMLAGRYADSRIRELNPSLAIDRVENSAKARKNAAMLLYLSGGVIPDRGYYNMRDATTKAKIGELDEEFVWERSLGEAFPFGNRAWRIARITHNDVEVTPVTKSNTLVPFWRAEEMNRSFFLSEKIALFLEDADETLKTTSFRSRLIEQHHMSESAADELIDFLGRQKSETKAPLPHRHHLLIEHFNDPANLSDTKQTIVHTLWGGRVNRPFAYALASAWEETYKYPLEIYVNNDCIMINLPHELSGVQMFDLVKPAEIRQRLRSKLESTGYFGARFRENAQRALLLPRQSFNKRMPLWLNRLRSKKLIEAVSHYDDFPVLLETWRQCLHREFEIDNLIALLEEIASGDIRITETITQKPSPFTDGVIWRQTNKLMYEDDSPAGKLRSNLGDELMKEVLYSAHLRPRFASSLIEELQQKLHRTAPGYSPSPDEELVEWIKERLLIPAPEWQALIAAIKRDHGSTPSEWLPAISDRLVFLPHSSQNAHSVIALENVQRFQEVLNQHLQDMQTTGQKAKEYEEENEKDNESLTAFLEEWLRYYGPVSHQFIMDALGLERNLLDDLETALEPLVEEGRIIVDEFRDPLEPGVPVTEEICDSGNLEILLRMRRKRERPVFESLDSDYLPLYLASYQKLTSTGETAEDLHNCLEKLFGYPARAALWETDILPARLSPYYTHWLDTAMREDGVTWFGCGKERCAFCFDSDVELFIEPGNQNESAKETGNAMVGTSQKVMETLVGTPGKLNLADLADLTNLPSAELTTMLWQLTWQGQVTNDDYQALRSGIMKHFRGPRESGGSGGQTPAIDSRYAPGDNKGYPQASYREHGQPGMSSPGLGQRRRPGARRLSFSRWRKERVFEGHWVPLDLPGVDDYDALDRQELVKDRIRQLFMRYGILFRELLWNELPPLRWGNIFPVLRLMELSGEIFTGQFFKGIQGLQFCTPAAFRILQGGLPGDNIFWMNATDPASFCGIALDELRFALPHRLATTHLVYHGKRLVVISKKNGKALEINVPPGHTRIPEYLEFFKVLLGRKFQPLKWIKTETINDQPVTTSPYRQDLLNFGFFKDYKTLTLEKSY